MNEACPGCWERFELGDITDILVDPWSSELGKEKRKWHTCCHQKAHDEWINRDRRSAINRAADEMWKK